MNPGFSKDRISPRFIVLPNSTYPTSNDALILQRIAQQDQHALLALYSLYGNGVYSLVFRILHKRELAEEVTQDVFLKVWQRPERWNPQLGKLSSWLLTIARNAAIDRLRKERRQPFQDTDPLELVGEQTSPRDMVDSAAWHDGQLVRELMTHLPTEQHQLVELAFFQGYTHRELAERLNLPLGTVKTRLRLGLRRLRILWEEAHKMPAIAEEEPLDRGT